MRNFTLLTLLLFFALGATKANPDNPPKANTEPEFEVKAYYYPDSRYEHSAKVQVLWGSTFYDFESQGQDPFSGWINDSIYPWTVTQPQIPGYHGNLCLMSGNSGVNNSTSSIQIPVYFVQDGSISFLGGCYGEGDFWDVCEFYIDDTLKFSNGALQTWETYSFDVSAGMHMFKWSYTKDGSMEGMGDAFFVDDVVFSGTSRLGDPGSVYNVYRRSFDATGAYTDQTKIADNVTGNQYMVVNWAELAQGEYQFGIENPTMETAGIFWSNTLNKSTVDYFEVTATVDPAIGGTVTGGGSFAYGEICTLKAESNNWYTFSYWTKNDTVIDGLYSPTYSFPVTENVTIQAHFDPAFIYYEVYAVPEEGGEAIMVRDTIQWEALSLGDTVTLKATPNDGFSFANWTAEGAIGQKSGQSRGTQFLSDSAFCSVIITEDLLNNIFEPYYIFDGDTIEGISDGAMIRFLANFEEGIGDCKRPKDFANIDLGPDFATFSWTEKGIAESWYICYHPVTPAYTEDIMVEVNENPCTITGLQPETQYQVFVVPSCGVEAGVPNSIVSSSSIMFTTLGPCPTPLHVEVDSVTGCTASVKWMDYSDSYAVETCQPDIVIDENFDNGIPSDWDNDSNYPWTVVNGRMQSGNAGVASSTSTISITATFNSNGYVDFDAECMGEGEFSMGYAFDYGGFFIDSDTLFMAGTDISGVNHYHYEVTAGTHTFTWSYTKDGSADNEGDYFAVDNILMVGAFSWDRPFTVEESQCTITGLNPLTKYAVHVQGICEDEETEWSNPVFFTTNDVCFITASVNPTGAGTVTGAGEYHLGDSCTLVATANTGYLFANWTKGGRIYSNEETFSFAVSEDAEFVANFERIEYYLSLSPAPQDGGSTEFLNDSTQVFHYGDEVSIKATPNQGYNFANWTVWGGNDEIGLTTNPIYNFTIGGNNPVTTLYPEGGQIALIANFEMRNLDITVTTNPVAGGTVQVSDTIFTGGTFAYGETLTMNAIENTGYTFQNWTKNDSVVSTSRTLNITVTESASYVANFTLNSYAIDATVNPAVGGTVTGTGTYTHGQTCTLTATANTGYHFLNWTLNNQEVSDSENITIEVTEAANYVANFEINSYAISATANPTIGGAIHVADTIFTGGTFEHNTQITMVAEAVTGYTFQNWTKNGTEVSTSASYSITVTEAASYVANFELNSYDVTAMVSVNPTNGGTVNGTGTYNYGQTCNLTAIPATGHHFVNWTKNGTEVSTDPNYSFVVTGEDTYVANFEINSYDVTAMVSVNPTNGGTVNGMGTFTYGQTCDLTAVPAEGFHFVKWTKNGTQVSTNPVYSFTVTEEANYVAYFEINSYAITATANPTEGGTITGAGTFNHFANCTLTATAATGYTFLRWTKNGIQVSTNPTYTFQVTEATSYVAHFQLNSYEITATANPTDGGMITGAGTYNHFENCTLTATPATGYHFVKWTKNGSQVSTNASYTFEVTGAASYVAHFELNSYAITATANPTVGGSITGTGTYNHFANCTLTATPATGYHFVKWTKNGTQVSANASYTFEVTGAASYVAHFELNSYAITATANPSDGGTITGAGTYNHFANCTLTATPATGYHFVKWTKNGSQVSTNASYTFEVTGAASYVAHFELNSYAITATANPTVGGSITGTGTYNHFANCTLTATPATGYHFVKWTKNGTQVSANASYTFEVTGAASYVAHFELNSYAITATANPSDGGTITGAGTYNHFANCTLTATAATGYTFLRWTKNGTQVSTNPTYTFQVTEAASYVAHFQLNSYAIGASANPTDGGTVTGAGTYNHFENCTLTATPATGYHFVNWTEGTTIVSTNASYNFQVTGARTLVANFEINGYTITAMANPTAGGTVTGAGSYNHFETCTLTATPNAGYYFVRWTKGSEIVSTEAEYSFEVTETATYKAHFAKIAYAITAEANPEEGGIITGTGESFYYNTTCQLKATANTGYHFVNWTKDGVEVSTNRIYNFTVTESAHYVANFELDTFIITASVDPEEGGSVTGAGTYNYGETVTLTAEAKPDYQFVNWTEGDAVVSEEATLTFEVDSDRQLVAHFISTWGIIDHDALKVSIYPNPASYKLTIEASEPVNTLEIYNINGALVSKQKNCSDKIEIYLESYAAGTYMIRLTTASGVEMRKFVKE